MAFACKLCAVGTIQPGFDESVNGRCDHCGQRYWHCQPARPELTEEQWAALRDLPLFNQLLDTVGRFLREKAMRKELTSVYDAVRRQQSEAE
jgi:hypothetical protein